MGKNISISLLENKENKAIALKNAIQEGLESPRVENFDFDESCHTEIRKEIDQINIKYPKFKKPCRKHLSLQGFFEL